MTVNNASASFDATPLPCENVSSKSSSKMPIIQYTPSETFRSKPAVLSIRLLIAVSIALLGLLFISPTFAQAEDSRCGRIPTSVQVMSAPQSGEIITFNQQANIAAVHPTTGATREIVRTDFNGLFGPFSLVPRVHLASRSLFVVGWGNSVTKVSYASTGVVTREEVVPCKAAQGDYVYDLVVDPIDNKLYYVTVRTNFDTPHKFFEANLDGSGERLLFSTDTKIGPDSRFVFDSTRRAIVYTERLSRTRVRVIRRNIDSPDVNVELYRSDVPHIHLLAYDASIDAVAIATGEGQYNTPVHLVLVDGDSRVAEQFSDSGFGPIDFHINQYVSPVRPMIYDVESKDVFYQHGLPGPISLRRYSSVTDSTQYLAASISYYVELVMVPHSSESKFMSLDHTNPRDPFDVNSSGTVTALDANTIITALGYTPGGVLPPKAVATSKFLDVNQSGHVSALDANNVISELARRANTAEGEDVNALIAGYGLRAESYLIGRNYYAMYSFNPDNFKFVRNTSYQWFYINVHGNLYRWHGTSTPGTYLGHLGVEYYGDPQLLNQ